jgi:DNA-directed RNA polymerase specialized sigma24 family protein
VVTTVITSPVNAGDINSESTWIDLYASLRSLARYLIYTYRVASWWGQEEDMIEDVVQETARRLVERTRKAERGEAEPIYSLKHMMTTIAQNYCKDLRRSDHRLLHMPPQDYAPEPFVNGDDQEQTLDTVIERVFEETIFLAIAHEIARFPAKQRNALLMDLANRMCFDIQPTPLQKAFMKERVQLQQYKVPLPTDPKERSRHNASLSYAYQRVGNLPCVQKYMLDSQDGTHRTRSSSC